MLLWRISRARHASDLTGTGARLAGGRWNPKGVQVVYCAATRSLCALEVFVHLDPSDVPGDLVTVGIDVPDDLFAARQVWRARSLPPGWRDHPAPAALQARGAAWVRARHSLVLEVPSAIVPAEANYLLNPAHPDMRAVTAGSPEPFTFDPRMWKGPKASRS